MSAPSRNPELPLAAASQRLRRRPGRPRTSPPPERSQGLGNPGPGPEPATEATIAAPCSRPVATAESGAWSVAPLRARLLDLDGAARYLALKPWHVRDLIRTGALARVSVPLGPDRRGRRANGRLRRVLVDVEDLDCLVAMWKAGSR
jgi:hypothetical protein